MALSLGGYFWAKVELFAPTGIVGGSLYTIGEAFAFWGERFSCKLLNNQCAASMGNAHELRTLSFGFGKQQNRFAVQYDACRSVRMNAVLHIVAEGV